MKLDSQLLKRFDGLLSSAWPTRVLAQKDFKLAHGSSATVTTFQSAENMVVTEKGQLSYSRHSKRKQDYELSLAFCFKGNELNGTSASRSSTLATKSFGEPENAHIFFISFSGKHLQSIASEVPMEDMHLIDQILSGLYSINFEKQVALCNKIKSNLLQILDCASSSSFESVLALHAQAYQILLSSLNCVNEEDTCAMPVCKFLHNEQDVQKIRKAKEILVNNLAEPITIKELSKKVAINECYLKKGFKEIYGSTIFEFYQTQRMEHATFLLYEKGLSVTDVSMMLGFSSLSHFSTAYKKFTGMKPCELLFRN